MCWAGKWSSATLLNSLIMTQIRGEWRSAVIACNWYISNDFGVGGSGGEAPGTTETFCKSPWNLISCIRLGKSTSKTFVKRRPFIDWRTLLSLTFKQTNYIFYCQVATSPGFRLVRGLTLAAHHCLVMSRDVPMFSHTLAKFRLKLCENIDKSLQCRSLFFF